MATARKSRAKAAAPSFTYPSGLNHVYTKAELESVKLPGFSLENALHLSANADTDEARDWWALYYVRMGSLVDSLKPAPVVPEAVSE